MYFDFTRDVVLIPDKNCPIIEHKFYTCQEKIATKVPTTFVAIFGIVRRSYEADHLPILSGVVSKRMLIIPV